MPGPEPVEKSPHDRSCFEATCSIDHGTPEEFTADLASRIAANLVVRSSLVASVLAEANYQNLIYDWKIYQAQRQTAANIEEVKKRLEALQQKQDSGQKNDKQTDTTNQQPETVDNPGEAAVSFEFDAGDLASM